MVQLAMIPDFNTFLTYADYGIFLMVQTVVIPSVLPTIKIVR